MTTALGFEVYPLRDELQLIGSMTSFGTAAARRPSGSAVSSTGSYVSSSSNHHPLSTLEDSGNVNNRGLLQQSSSQQRCYSQSERDSSTYVNTGGGGGASLQRMTSNGSIKQQQTSLSPSRTNESCEATEDTAAERVIEEKRKRANGDSFSIHRYTLGRLLGKGGFAKVYLCTAMDTGKNYAVKVVPKANLVKARARQKLQAEIKIHRNLKHRYVCQYKHYFEDRNNCYILLELCHNQSLNEMIKRRKRLTEPEAAYFMKQLLEATRYMHEQNVIHRDLKLGNLFLDKDMSMKVGDLGLATRVEDKDERRKTICGTPNYIAPEIIQGDKTKRGHSFEVDVWSMGVILYTVLIGKPPYEAKDVKATYQRILNNEYSFPRHTEISPSAKSLIKAMLQSQPSDRPSLDEIEVHPFLADSQIPTFLPTSTLSIAPVWRVNEYGELVCSDKSLDCASKKPSLPRSNSGRQPFASRDPNKHKAASTTTPMPRREKDVINMERVVKTAVAAMTGVANCSTQSCSGNVRKTSSVAETSPAFKIFDESQSARNPTPAALEEAASRDESPRSSPFEAPPARRQMPPVTQLTEEALSQQTRAMSLTGPSPRHNSGASSVFTHATESVFSNTDNDADILQHMVDHLVTVINVTESRKGSYRSTPLRPLSSRRGPSKWVIRYVDYTSKYGLGFLLNDGCSGVYFNDSTKTALEPHGESFQYIERKRVDDEGTSKRRGETIVETHSMENYPEALKKKVTLLKHFRNYLLQQQLTDEDEDFAVDSQSDALTVPDLVYVKKWVRTKHAILFSLSNRTVQAIFYDQTEILLTPDVTFLTYVDKNRKRFTYNFTDELVGACAEIEKRLKYTKEIMLQLLSGQRS